MTAKIYEDFCDVEDPRGSWVRGEDYLLLWRALELCNESRDRLTRFHAEPEFWIEEAKGEQ